MRIEMRLHIIHLFHYLINKQFKFSLSLFALFPTSKKKYN